MSYAVFTYRCRQCGTVYESNTECSVGSATPHLVKAIYTVRVENQPPVALLEIHNCDEGKEGVADLAGYVVKEDS